MRKITFLLFFTLNFLTAQTTYNFDWSYGTPDQQIEIEVGDTVNWTWTGSGSHNLIVTSGVETFDSGYHTAGWEFSHTFNAVSYTHLTLPTSAIV